MKNFEYDIIRGVQALESTIVNIGCNILAFSCLEMDAVSIHVVSFTPTSEFIFIYDSNFNRIGKIMIEDMYWLIFLFYS